VQGKTKRVTDLLPLLQEFYRDKLSAVLQHTADARVVSDYDANNTYQYIINREETELSWVAQAIVELGGEVPTAAASQSERAAADMHAAVEQDVREAQAFVDRWRPRIDAMSNARHRKMLNVILGEALEQKRFFEQALAGRHDLLGRRTEDVGPLVGKVLPTRWIE
jgi:bacterioferritin (cytochrome b1)